MSTVTVGEAWPASGHPFTVEELGRMPDDGRRYELLEGTLVVSPRPGMPHQVVATRLVLVLGNACPPGLHVVAEPAVQLAKDTEFVPDIAVVGTDQINEAKCISPPVLAVEVRSPSAALIDLNRKKAAYERFGVASYWIVVPDPDSPALIAFDLHEDHYAETAHITGDGTYRATRPFPVEITPANLVAGLRTPG
ncbi:MAG TPA: Uma2 family endonuclease [Streptosporangiaceae bacterium]|nr:Uma2 family endonuclease [Streptosporangiaceae bacterium]